RIQLPFAARRVEQRGQLGDTDVGVLQATAQAVQAVVKKFRQLIAGFWRAARVAIPLHEAILLVIDVEPLEVLAVHQVPIAIVVGDNRVWRAGELILAVNSELWATPLLVRQLRFQAASYR